MSRRGYSHYYSKKTARDVLKLIVALLAVLLVLAVAFLIWGRQYLVYTENGVRLELPFFQREPAAPSPDVPPVNIVEVLPPEPDQSGEEPPPEEDFWTRAVTLTLDELEAGGVSAVTDQGANTVILNMKQEDGYLNFVSAQSMAQGLSTAQDRVGPQIYALHQAGLRAVAQVSCFRDNALGMKGQYAIVTNSGYLWCYDERQLYWTSPANGEVQDYLAALAGELAALGFDEILLVNCGYPTSGNIGWIRRGEAYDPGNLHLPIDALLEKMNAALEGTQTTLAVRTTPQVLLGQDTQSGQTAAGLERSGVRLWLTGDGVNDPVELARQAGISDPEHRVAAAAAAFTEGTTNQFLE